MTRVIRLTVTYTHMLPRDGPVEVFPKRLTRAVLSRRTVWREYNDGPVLGALQSGYVYHVCIVVPAPDLMTAPSHIRSPA